MDLLESIFYRSRSISKSLTPIAVPWSTATVNCFNLAAWFSWTKILSKSYCCSSLLLAQAILVCMFHVWCASRGLVSNQSNIRVERRWHPKSMRDMEIWDISYKHLCSSEPVRSFVPQLGSGAVNAAHAETRLVLKVQCDPRCRETTSWAESRRMPHWQS